MINSCARSAPLGQPITERSENEYFLAFSPDGHFLATGSDDALGLWDLDVDHAIERICDTTRGILTPELWRQYLDLKVGGGREVPLAISAVVRDIHTTLSYFLNGWHLGPDRVWMCCGAALSCLS